jgi:hypothetical protein
MLLYAIKVEKNWSSFQESTKNFVKGNLKKAFSRIIKTLIFSSDSSSGSDQKRRAHLHHVLRSDVGHGQQTDTPVRDQVLPLQVEHIKACIRVLFLQMVVFIKVFSYIFKVRNLLVFNYNLSKVIVFVFRYIF